MPLTPDSAQGHQYTGNQIGRDANAILGNVTTTNAMTINAMTNNTMTNNTMTNSITTSSTTTNSITTNNNIHPPAAELDGKFYSTVLQQTNPWFTGREDILNRLQAAINSHSYPGQCRIVLQGLGGQGKSEICLQLANHVQQWFQTILWVDVATRASAETDFKEAADMLQLAPSTLRSLKRYLASCRQPWLLILDNADDPMIDYHEYIPSGKQGVVILTTRIQDCCIYANPNPDNLIVVEGLSENEAVMLLLKISGPSDQHANARRDAKAIVDLLGAHTLALIQAGTLIRRGKCTLATYPKLYQQIGSSIWKTWPSQAPSRYKDVYTTFEASARVLQELSADALDLLSVTGMLEYRHYITMSTFELVLENARYISSQPAPRDNALHYLDRAHTALLPMVFQVDESNGGTKRLEMAIRSLESFAFISRANDLGKEYILFHPLIHAWASHRQSAEDRKSSLLSAVCMLCFANIVTPKNRELLRAHWPELGSAQAQALMTTSNILTMLECGPDDVVLPVILRCGWHLAGAVCDLHSVVDGLLTHYKLPRDQAQPGWFEVYLLVATLYKEGSTADQEKSVRITQQIAELAACSFGAQNMFQRLIQFSLAVVHLRLQQHEQAVSIFDEWLVPNLEIMTDKSGRWFPMTYDHIVRPGHVTNLLREIVQYKAEVVLEDDDSLLRAKRLLGRVYLAMEQFGLARSINERILAIYERKFEAGHPDIRKVQAALAYGRRNRRITVLRAILPDGSLGPPSAYGP